MCLQFGVFVYVNACLCFVTEFVVRHFFLSSLLLKFYHCIRTHTLVSSMNQIHIGWILLCFKRKSQRPSLDIWGISWANCKTKRKQQLLCNRFKAIINTIISLTFHFISFHFISFHWLEFLLSTAIYYLFFSRRLNLNDVCSVFMSDEKSFLKRFHSWLLNPPFYQLHTHLKKKKKIFNTIWFGCTNE